MDYKEIIRAMRSLSPKEVFCRSIDAADAIETLLAERDALLAEIRGECAFCAFETGACVACDDGERWQWRGLKRKL